MLLPLSDLSMALLPKWFTGSCKEDVADLRQCTR